MQVAIGVLGALAIVCYITGMVLVVRSEKESGDTLQKVVASGLVIGGWLLTFAFAIVGNWGANSLLISLLSIAAIGLPVIGLALHYVERKWIPALFVLLGMIATPVLYYFLLKG